MNEATCDWPDCNETAVESVPDEIIGNLWLCEVHFGKHMDVLANELTEEGEKA